MVFEFRDSKFVERKVGVNGEDEYGRRGRR